MATLLLLGIVLGYAGSRAETYFVNKTADEYVAQEEEIQIPEEKVLTEEDKKLLVDADGSDYMLGDANATVTIVEFSDFQCPFCGKYSTETFPQIKQSYIDTGKVKYYFRDFPLDFHPQAKDASKAANCAGAQGKYWEMHDEVFKNQSAWSGNADVLNILKGYAKTLGLNKAEFDKCIADANTENEIFSDLLIGSQLGASGTPTFFINGEKLVGAQPYQAFETAISEALSN